MLDMGFEADVHNIARHVARASRQVLLFTATWPPAVQRVAEALLCTGESQPQQPPHVRVTVGGAGDTARPAANRDVCQRVRIVDPGDKWAAFLQVLDTVAPKGQERVLIFCNTRREVNSIGAYCAETGGFACDTLSGDRSQGQREACVRDFRDGRISMVVATDVAARGLDVTGIDRVINYDFPPGDGGLEEYVHRIGRTARAGATGVAETLFTFVDSKHAAPLAALLRDAGQPVPDGLDELASSKRPRSHHGGRGVKAKQQKAEELAEALAQQKADDDKKQRAEAFRAQCEASLGE